MLYCAYWNVPTFIPRKWKGEAQIKVKKKKEKLNKTTTKEPDILYKSRLQQNWLSRHTNLCILSWL